MLQSSQIENPRCSAKIDQMRLRRAMNLPVDSQNLSSSGFQSEIQLRLRLLISVLLSRWHRALASRAAGTEDKKRRPRRSKASLPGGGVACGVGDKPATPPAVATLRAFALQASCQKADTRRKSRQIK